jgi:DNA-binding CsgD family transcriptional regulator
MIPLDLQHWQKLNRMAVEIHTVGSRDELVSLVAGRLPNTLNAERVRWREHGPAASIEPGRDANSSLDHILALILARKAAAPSHPSAVGSGRGFDQDGIFDVDALITSSRQSDKTVFECNDQASRTCHQIATQFFIDDHRGILLTVKNSAPFTDVQKFSLLLLREHLAVAARRHYHQAADPVNLHPIPTDSVLSRREKEVFPYLVKGFTNPEIANTLGISPRTVEKHVASILDKSGRDNRRMLIGLNLSPSSANPAVKNG